MTEYKLVHFNTRFLAEPIRFIFAFCDVPFEDVRVTVADWQNMKEETRFNQLPLLELSDGRQLSQSGVICRYLARIFNICGKDEWEAARCSEIADNLRDMRQEWRKYFFETDPETKAAQKVRFVDKVTDRFFGWMERIQIDNGGEYLVGEQITWADLLFATSAGFFEDTVDLAILEPYPNLKKVKNKIWSHPNIRAWLQKRPVPNIKIIREIPLAV